MLTLLRPRFLVYEAPAHRLGLDMAGDLECYLDHPGHELVVEQRIQTAAMVTTSIVSTNGRNATALLPKRIERLGTRPTPNPHPTKPICETTDPISCMTRGEKPASRHAATMMSK